MPLAPALGSMPRAQRACARAGPGLYWAAAAEDPAGASKLGPGSLAHPFFVAANDDAALAFGTNPAECVPPADPRSTARALSICLALAAPIPVPRWVALDGFEMEHARDAEKRTRGLAVALGAILLAVVLETVILLRAAVLSRARVRALAEAQTSSPVIGRAWSLGVALLVATLGFLLLAAFLVRAG